MYKMQCTERIPDGLRLYGAKRETQKKKFKGGYGISHIIAKRLWEGKHDPQFKGQKASMVVKKVLETVSKGKRANPEQTGNIQIDHEEYRAVLSPNMDGKTEHWLLTGFKKNNP